MIFVASKVSGHCSIVIVFDVKYMTLESVYDSISSLSYIFCLAPGCTLCNRLNYCSGRCHSSLYCSFCYSVCSLFSLIWEIFLQHLHEFGLLQP